MDIDSVDGDDGSITFTVKLTPEDVAAYPNAIAVLNASTTCAEMLLGLSIVALEMQAKQGEFQMALRSATAERAKAGPYAWDADDQQFVRAPYRGPDRRVSVEKRNPNRLRRRHNLAIAPSPDNVLGQDLRKATRRKSHRRADDAL